MSVTCASTQQAAPLYECAVAFADRDPAPFYCPGHKGGRTLPYEFRSRIADLDLNNLPETDTLHCPTGPIRRAEELMAAAYGVDHSFFLVGGSSAGNTSALMATLKPGEKVLVQRNVHKSTIAGLIHSGARPIWLSPNWDGDLQIAHGLDAGIVSNALHQHTDARVLVALNPTYYGTVPDIEKLCGVCREAECLLIVDEAHGPHFHFHPDLPQAAEDAGADAIVQSTHKVISGLSQAAALHIQGGEIEVPQIRKVLQLFQTTSPNFAIMASIDLARRQMALEGRQRFTEILQLGREARERLSAIDGVRMLEPPRYAKPGAGFFDLDETKLMIDVTRLGRSGEEVHRILRTEFNVQPELSGPTHVLCILTIGSHLSDIDRLVDAMQSIADQSWSGSRHAKHLAAQAGQLVSSTPESELTPREAFCSPTVRVPLNQATGRICAEVVTPYPPGIPALVPGERISDEIVEFLKQVLQSGCPISAAVPSLETLEVIR